MDNSTNILTKIQLQYNQMTKTEQKIARVVLDDPQKVLFMSITELADACKVAEASVHRFCRAIGMKGYQEFKMTLSTSMNADEARRKPKAGEENERLCDRIMEQELSAIKETNALLDEAVVKKTVDLMSSAKRIWFFGVGNSLISALDAQARFLHITPKVCIAEDTHLQSMAASMTGPEDMCIFLSFSGATSDTIHTAQIAKDRGAKMCAITRYPKSDLTKLCDTVLLCGSREGPLEGGSMDAKISQLYLVEVLFQYYYENNSEASRANTRSTAKATVNRFV